jgi:hypothetical protein
MERITFLDAQWLHIVTVAEMWQIVTGRYFHSSPLYECQ